MIQKLFGIRDGKTQAFLQPFFSPQPGSAIRAFDDECNNEKSPFNRHPGDYVLYELADFDDNTGEIVSLVPIKALGHAIDFVRPTSAVSSIIRPEEVTNGSEKVG